MIFVDAPRHSKLRALISQAFTPRSIANLGKVILPMMGSANRDPKVFHDPNRFDISRDPKSAHRIRPWHSFLSRRRPGGTRRPHRAF